MVAQKELTAARSTAARGRSCGAVRGGGGGAHASKGGQGARGERKPAAARPSPLGRCAVVSVGMLLHCNASDRVLCNAMGQCL